jgi:hypothetical protein
LDPVLVCVDVAAHPEHFMYQVNVAALVGGPLSQTTVTGKPTPAVAGPGGEPNRQLAKAGVVPIGAVTQLSVPVP